MLLPQRRTSTRNRTSRLGALISAAVLVVAGLSPFLSLSSAQAGQITARKATLNSSKTSGSDTEFAFSYSLPNTTTKKEGIIYQFCTTPLGACTKPTGMLVQAATHDAQTGFPDNGTAFATHAVSDESNCDMSTTNSKVCFERDGTSAVTGGAVTHTISGITPPSTAQTVYIRISTYSDADEDDDSFETAELLDTGVVAVAFTTQLVINGRVQERLNFCIGTVDSTYTAAAGPTSCGAVSGTTVDLGVIDNTTLARSPVAVTPNEGNDRNGIALLDTNAAGGTTITYYTEQDATSGKFKIAGATCSGSSTTDQCFNSTGTTQNSIVAGTEEFGMTISCVGRPTGNQTTNLTRDGDYDGDGSNTCTAAVTDFAWDDTGTIDQIASSSSVVDNEALLLRFGASAAATTPTGQYTVTATFIATPTF